MVYVMLADGFEEVEAIEPIDILKRGGVDVTTVGVKSKTVTGAHGIEVTADIEINGVEPEKMELLMLPGGIGHEILDASNDVHGLLNYAVANRIYVSAICAAPSILGKKMLLEDKKATCFPGYEKYLYGADVKSDKVVVDGKFITGKGAGAAADFGFAMLAILKDKETADRVKEDEVKIKSDEIRQRLLGVERVKQAKTICTFISAFKEPDTVEIIKELWEQDKKIVVPITDIESGTLSLSYINSMDDMKKGAYGILEPKTVRKADENNIDVILVPGLAFDRNGGRMGFGKGYYDRLLESSKAVKIGLCYDFQILEKIPTESHDVPMNFVITEKEILEIR